MPNITIDETLKAIRAACYSVDGTIVNERDMAEKFSDFVSVKDFGATGDGVTDDTAAIQEAIDFVVAASSATGTRTGMLYMPRGIYYATSLTDTNQVVFIGDGALWARTSSGAGVDQLTDGTRSEKVHNIGALLTALPSPIINITNYTNGQPDSGSGTDVTTALDLAIADLTGDSFVIYFPEGAYTFNSKPDNIDVTCHIIGAGKGKTVFYKNWASSNEEDGIINFRSGASFCKVAGIRAIGQADSESGGLGTGCIISAVADASDSTSGLIIDDVWITSQSTSPNAYLAWCIFIDGTAKTSGAIGIRDIAIRDCFLFGAESGSLALKGVVNANVNGGATFDAGGNTGKIVIDGDATVNSFYVIVNMCHMAEVELDYINACSITGYINGDLTNTSNSDGCTYIGDCSGTIEADWSTSRAYRAHSFEAVETGKTIAASTIYTSTHSLGVAPNLIRARLRCTTTEYGYAVGDEIEYLGNEISFFIVSAHTSQIRYVVGPTVQIVRRDTGAFANITLANWVLELDAYVM